MLFLLANTSNDMIVVNVFIKYFYFLRLPSIMLYNSINTSLESVTIAILKMKEVSIREVK